MNQRVQDNYLHRGRWANADVYTVYEDNGQWVVKDYSKKPFFVRWTIGTFLTSRECRFLNQLDGMEGIPRRAQRLKPFSLRYEYVGGVDMGQARKRGIVPDEQFCRATEHLLYRLHKRGIAHLDMRRSGNIIITDEGKPVLIDFQSAMNFRWMPRGLRRFLCVIDYSGIYKHWSKITDRIGARREKLLAHTARLRRLWLFQSYPLRNAVRQFRKRKARRKAAET